MLLRISIYHGWDPCKSVQHGHIMSLAQIFAAWPRTSSLWTEWYHLFGNVLQIKWQVYIWPMVYEFYTFSNDSISLRSCIWNYFPKLPSTIEVKAYLSFIAALLSSVAFSNFNTILLHTFSINEELSFSSLTIEASTVLKLKWNKSYASFLTVTSLNYDS